MNAELREFGAAPEMARAFAPKPGRPREAGPVITPGGLTLHAADGWTRARVYGVWQKIATGVLEGLPNPPPLMLAVRWPSGFDFDLLAWFCCGKDLRHSPAKSAAQF